MNSIQVVIDLEWRLFPLFLILSTIVCLVIKFIYDEIQYRKFIK